MTLEEIRKNAPPQATHYADDYDGIVYIALYPWGFCYSNGSIIPDYELYNLDLKPLH